MMENYNIRLAFVCFCAVLCAALVLSFGTAATASWQPYFLVDSFQEWSEAKDLGRIQPMTEAQWGDYMAQWNMSSWVEGEPYPPTRFVPPELYVWGGGGSGGLNPEDAGLVMVWHGPEDPTVKYSSAWRYDYGLDPDLSNSTITLTVTAPQFSLMPPPSQVNNVSFGIQDILGNVRSWHWACGPGQPIQWNIPTTITINTAMVGVMAASPVATGYVNSPAFNIVQSMNFIVDENATWVGGPQPVPPPGGMLPAIWNYWHNISVTPNQPQKNPDPIKWSQPPVFLSQGTQVPLINGWDEFSMYHQGPPIVADDWECKDRRPVTDFHWWGSFLKWTQPYPPPLPRAFHLAIWTDVAAKPPEIPFSHPGTIVWEHLCDNYQWNFAGYDKDPRGQMENEACFQFNQWLTNPDEWFYQDPGPDGKNVYWLSIAAIYDPTQPTDFPWGWKTRPHYFNDDAVRIFQVFDPTGLIGWPPVKGSTWAQGQPIEWQGESWDLAFELTTTETNEPKDDLGDAPDSTNSTGAIMSAYPPGGPMVVQANYPTEYQAGSPPNGPLHWKPLAVAYLGPAVTLENEADSGPDQDPTNNILPMVDQPDKDLADDGVIFPLVLPNCQSTTFQYTVTAVMPNQQLYVNVWFDWNRDGDWDDTMMCPLNNPAPEWAVQNQPLMFAAPGLYTVTSLPFLPWNPIATDPTPIWMRITLSEQRWSPPSTMLGYGGSGPAAGYQFGETEDYYFKPEIPHVEMDFGDAPDSYVTKLPNGARHQIAPNMFMGILIDAEPDGQPNGTATGDDIVNLADEDGVTLSKLARGCPAVAKILVSAPGMIDAWIDWAGDGTFAPLGDQIFASVPVVPGVNKLKFKVPANAVLGDTFARFRYSSAGGLSYDGAAKDGEVEDYMVKINPSPIIVNKGKAKLLPIFPIGTEVLILKDVVTANFGRLGWYFEEPDRDIGPARVGGRSRQLGVMGEENWAINDVVTCYGITTLVGCELMIDEYGSIIDGESSAITPLGQTNKGSGGGKFGNQPGVMDFVPGLIEPRPAFGLNSIALLVKLWGRCTCVEEPTGGPNLQANFWIDDGSNLWDGNRCTSTEKPALGVKVRIPDGYAGPPIVRGAYYAVVGIMRTGTSPYGDCVRWLWPRMESDIQFIPEPVR
ncbi:MAG: GEVED domain-containing protein [Armatimonadetes bacterium]|nr:GEVED domain-containing protein [Armatimonadota bacterium]